MSALQSEMKVTACTPHTGKQSINSAISQDVKPCRVLLLSINVCSVSRHGGMQGGEGRGGVSKHVAGIA